MNLKVGFIGIGNMGQAMLGGILKSKLLPPERIIVCDLDNTKLEIITKEYGVSGTTDANEVVKFADIIVLAIKPNIYDIVMNNIKSNVDENKVIVAIAAGKTISSMEKILGDKTKIIRTMPNTPALVNEGMTAICSNKNVLKEEIESVKMIFESFGKAEIVKEELINTIIGISGSSPAYVFMFIEAMADAAVAKGLPRDMAYKFASQAVLGSAKMVLETGKHPGELKDMVCSPGGTTIEAVSTLEKEGFRAAVISGVEKCIEKAEKMSK